MSFKDATAVIRTAVEVDPVYFGSLSIKEKVVFSWGIENILRANRVPYYYFNIQEGDDRAWHDAVKSFGAEQVSQSPEIRYRKALL